MFGFCFTSLYIYVSSAFINLLTILRFSCKCILMLSNNDVFYVPLQEFFKNQNAHEILAKDYMTGQMNNCVNITNYFILDLSSQHAICNASVVLRLVYWKNWSNWGAQSVNPNDTRLHTREREGGIILQRKHLHCIITLFVNGINAISKTNLWLELNVDLNAIYETTSKNQKNPKSRLMRKRFLLLWFIGGTKTW